MGDVVDLNTFTDVPCEGSELKQPPAPNDADITDILHEAMQRGKIDAKHANPIDVLRLALEECLNREDGLHGLYLTVLHEDGDAFSVTNYRAGMNNLEEATFRQLGAVEALDRIKADG